jgi:hypothetical protein
VTASFFRENDLFDMSMVCRYNIHITAFIAVRCQVSSKHKLLAIQSVIIASSPL